MFIEPENVWSILKTLKPRVPLYTALFFRLKYLVFEAEAFRLPDNVAVVDIETTGLDHKRDRMLTLGIYRSDRITIYQLLFGKDLREYSIVKRAIEDLKPLKVYAWYKDFEEKWLGLNGLHELQIYNFEMKDRSIQIKGLESEITGSNVPLAWREWREKGDICMVLAIVQRNYFDLLTEAASLVRFPLHAPRTLLISSPEEEEEEYEEDYYDEEEEEW